MHIRTRLSLIAALPLLLGAIIAAACWPLTARVERRLQQYDLVRRLQQGAFELDLLTREARHHPNPRVFAQWEARFSSIRKLAEKVAEEKNFPRTAPKLKRELNTIHGVFAQLRQHQEQADIARRSAPNQALLESFSFQISDRARAIVAFVTEMAQASQRAFRQDQLLGYGGIAIAVIALGGALFGFSLAAGRRIASSLARLEQFSREVGEGQLHKRVDLPSGSGFNSLARHLNAMAANLQQVTASRDELNREVTQRKAAEARLAQEQAQITTLFDGIEDVIYVSDPETFDLVYVNSAFTRIWGDDVIGKKCYAVIQGRDSPCPFCTNNRIFGTAKETAYVWEFQNELSGSWFRCSDKTIRWSDGRRLRFELASDITQHRLMEQQLRQAEKMQAIGQLAGGVAHEFNNQLAVITGFAELLMRSASITGDKRLFAQLEQIVVAGGRASELTSQLLAYSHSQEIELRPLDINLIVNNLTKMLQRLLGEDISFSLALSEGPAVINADQGQLTDLIVNLSANARDAMPEGGQLVIETSHCEVQEVPPAPHLDLAPGRYAILKVTDTGEGIPADALPHIFEPFFTTKPTGKGTGLGLSMVFSTVSAQGGAVDVTSCEGEGTAFTLYLPAVDKEEKPEGTVPAEAHCMPRGTGTILLVEDEPGVQAYLVDVLDDLGYDVIECANAQDAGKHFAEAADSIRLLLTDVVMPDIHGFELAHTLQREKPDLKVLCLSGYSRELVQQRSHKTSEFPVLSKPVSPDLLARTLQEILNP